MRLANNRDFAIVDCERVRDMPVLCFVQPTGPARRGTDSATAVDSVFLRGSSTMVKTIATWVPTSTTKHAVFLGFDLRFAHHHCLSLDLV